MDKKKSINEAKKTYKPIIRDFLNKLEKLTDDEIKQIDNDNIFCLELTNTGLAPDSLLELMKEFGYGNEEYNHEGWELDFYIDITKSGSYPSTCEELCIHGCGISFTLYLSVKKFM